MKEIKAIKLEFENTDYMVFEPKDFVYFSIDDIWTEIKRCGFGIDKFVHADTVEMHIKWEANDWHKPFENDDAPHDEFKFDRIQDYDDITHITVVYDDRTTERYVVNWEDATEYGEENKKQISVTTNDGLLVRVANDVWWDTKDSGKKWRYEQTDKEKEEDKDWSANSKWFKRYIKGKNENITETVEPKHGHWINASISANDHEYSYEAECDLCGARVHNNFSSVINYCPRCGAKMNEDEWQEPEEPNINPCRGCDDYDGQGGCKSNGGCGTWIRMDEVTEDET